MEKNVGQIGDRHQAYKGEALGPDGTMPRRQGQHDDGGAWDKLRALAGEYKIADELGFA